MRMATTLELGMGGRKVKEMKEFRTRGVSEERKADNREQLCFQR